MTAPDSLSKAQVGHLLDSGGFSVRAYGPDLGDRAKNGYVVAMAGHGADYAPRATAAQGHQFVRSREAQLRPEGRFFGGWTGADPPRTALDVSQLHPSSFTGHVAAAHQAYSTNQEAFGHLDPTGTDYTEIANPHYDPQGGHAERSVSMAQMGSAITGAHTRHPHQGIDQPVPSRGSLLTNPSRAVR